MNLAAALIDARQIRRVQRAQRAICRRYWATTKIGKAAARRSRFAHWWQRAFGLSFGLSFPAAPLLIPLFTWFAVRENGGPWRFLACLLVFVFRGHFFQSLALDFSAADVLRAPSKAGLVLTRLYQQIPRFLFVGGCLGLAYAIELGDAALVDPAPASLLLGAVVFSPAAQAIGKLRARLIGGAASGLGPLLVPTLASIYVYSEWGSPLVLWRILACAFVATLGIAALVRIAYEWMRQPLLHLRVTAAELTMLPHMVVGLGLLTPTTEVRSVMAMPLLPICALAVVVLVSLQSLSRLVVEVHFAEESTSGSAMQRVDANVPGRDDRVQAVLPTTTTGRRSLMRARLFLHRRRHWFHARELASPLAFVRNLPGILLRLLYHAWGPMLAALASTTTESRAQVTLALLACLTAPAMVVTHLNWQLHRLGVDFVAQCKHNLHAFALFAALPTLLAATAVGSAIGWNDDRLLVVALLAATLSWRAGWRGFFRTQETEHRNPGAAMAGLAAIAVSLVLPPPPMWVVLLAAGAGTVGLLLRLRRLNEATLADAMRANNELTQ